MTDQPTLMHGTLISCNGKGVLLLGPSGAGKSDLALRFIMLEKIDDSEKNKPLLVADDQVEIRKSNDTLWGQAPKALQGLIEVYHLGIQSVPYLSECQIHSAIQLKNRAEIARYPDENHKLTPIDGISLPLFYLDPFEISSINKLKLIFQQSPS